MNLIWQMQYFAHLHFGNVYATTLATLNIYMLHHSSIYS